jgi:hypothetical protein
MAYHGSAAGFLRAIESSEAVFRGGMMSDSKQAWDSMHVLSERILAANSATLELERWCSERVIGDGRIVALCARDAKAGLLDDESLEALYPHQALNRTEFRRVQLATKGIVVVDALNWYFPEHLTSEICAMLRDTDIPFGHAIRSLKPKRRTFLVRRCSPAQLAEAKLANDPTAIAFEHHAIVHREDGAPLAVVHERFRTALVEPHAIPAASAAFRSGVAAARVLAG